MRRTRFDDAACPVARTTDLLGDWWTPLVLRELLMGNRRFAALRDRLQISRPVLTQRLKRLQEEGLVDRVPYQQRPVRYEYRLTDKGAALWDVVAAMWRYGDDWLFESSPQGATVELVDRRTGQTIRPKVIDETTGEALDLGTTRLRMRKG